MSLGVTIEVNDQATPQAFKLRAALNRGDVKRVLGRSIAQSLKDHFYRLDGQRANSLGGRRTHYWAGAARSVQQPNIQSDGLSIAINQIGVGHRYYGGTITAGQSGSGKKWLTIPARSEAYGRRALEFHNLHFVLFRSDLAALVENVATRIKRTSKGIYKAIDEVGGGVFYWLVRSVYHKPDPEVLPKTEEMTTPAFDAASSYLGRLWAREEGGAAT